MGLQLPNQLIELTLEDNLGKEIVSDIIEMWMKQDLLNLNIKTRENDDEEGTWTLIATQKDNSKEFTYVGYGEIPTISSQY